MTKIEAKDSFDDQRNQNCRGFHQTNINFGALSLKARNADLETDDDASSKK